MRIELDLVDAIDYYDDFIEDIGPFRVIEIISWKGWDDPGYDEHQVAFNKQADELLKLFGCNFDSSEISEGPNSCSVTAFDERECGGGSR